MIHETFFRSVTLVVTMVTELLGGHIHLAEGMGGESLSLSCAPLIRDGAKGRKKLNKLNFLWPRTARLGPLF